MTFGVAAVVFVIAQPYAVIDGQTFIADTIREAQIARGSLPVPYTLQYAGTLPYLYSIWQLTLWGLGFPLGIAAWTSLIVAFVRWLRQGSWQYTLLLGWAGPYLAVSGLLYTKHVRYMLPLVPVLCILAARMMARIRVRSLRLLSCSLLVVSTLAYSLVFVSLYSHSHPWIVASEWVYAEVPPGSTILVEEWDRALPLPLELDGQSRRQGEYDLRALPVYDEPEYGPKWLSLTDELAASDYLILATRRAYGPISRLPEQFPIASQYYHKLLTSELGFELVGEFAREPAWLNPRTHPLVPSVPRLIQPDESFVVYDHPRALVFYNSQSLTAEELLRRIR
jgi:hypothetical protein